jgi:hypothetical protein
MKQKKYFPGHLLSWEQVTLGRRAVKATRYLILAGIVGCKGGPGRRLLFFNPGRLIWILYVE